MGIHTAIAVSLFLLFSTHAMSQTSRGKTSPFETEESIRERQRWFYDMRRNAGGIIDEQNRWDEFRKVRNETLNRTNKLSAAQWASLGPNTVDSLAGRMLSHAFDPTDNQTIWAGSGSGGLWRTTNGGGDWESMTDEIPSLYISCVAIKPSDRNMMLIGTGTDRYNGPSLSPGIGVLRSTDRGVSWTQTGFSSAISAGVSASKLVWLPDGSSTVYLAASTGVWKSTDDGETWTLSKAGRAATIVVNPQSPQIMYTPLRTDGIYRTTNGGTTWSRMENGLPIGSNVGLTSLSQCEEVPSVLYVGVTHNTTFSILGFYKTTNGGDSWTALPNAPNVYCYPPPNSSICLGTYVNVVGVSRTNPDHVLFGSALLYRTSDGGASWTRHDHGGDPTAGHPTPGKTHVDQWDIGFDPTNSNTVYIFNDGGVQKSLDGGLWWNKSNRGLITEQFYKIASAPSDTNLLIGGSQDHGHMRLNSAGGNTRWHLWSRGDGTTVIVHPTNINVFYGDFFFGRHVRSQTGGINWGGTTQFINNGMTETGQLIAPLLMHPHDPNVLYCAGLTKIFMTVNGGSLWTPIADLPNVYTMAIDRQDPNILYAHAYTGSTWAIWKSTNGGFDWTAITHPTIPTWRVVDLEVDPSNSGVLYAVRNSFFPNSDHIKKSTDFGETWSDITANLPDVTMNAITISPYSPDHLYVGTDLGAFASTSGGMDWFEFNDGLPLAYAADIHYHPLDRTIRLATLGRGAWKSKAIDALTTSVDDNDLAQLPGDFRLSQNYPNPFNPSTTVRYELRWQSRVVLTVHDQLGQEIRRLVDASVSPGEHSVVWDGLNKNGLEVASGVYFVRARANGFAQTMKTLLTR
ncbi:MAG: FlgD immunoglobulin-like domain containing protein [Bacteroidota bacterium]